VRAAHVPALLRERDFRLFYFGQAVSDFGDKLVPVALAFAVLDLTNSASALGIVLLSRTVPNVVFLLAGGVWADRLPRHKLMQACNVVRGVAQAAFAALLVSGHARLWELAALAVVYGTADAFFGPASTGLLQQVVRPERLQEANGLMSLSRSTFGIGAPALAGVLVVAVGPGWAIAIDAATFWASAGFLARLRAPAPRRERERFVTELREGWREVSSRTWLWVSIASFALFQFACLGPYLVLGPVIARDSLGGASAYAVISAAAGAGAVVGGLVTLRVRPRRPLQACFGSVVVWAALLVAYGFSAPVPVIAAAAVVGTAAMNFGSSLWFTTLQQHVPPHAISRVSSYDWMGSMVFLPLGLGLAGTVSHVVGAGNAMLGAAAIAAVANGAMAFLPSVRTLARADGDELEETGERPAPPVVAVA
jgi:MFS family permease